MVRRHGKWAIGSWCWSCCRKRKLAYYADNAEKCIAYTKRYTEEHSAEVKASQKRFRQENAAVLSKRKAEDYQKNKAKRAATNERWRARNREKVRKQATERMRYMRQNDPQTAIVSKLRSRVYWAVRDAGARKHKNTMDMVGCTIDQLLQYLETLFVPGMTWENRSLWHLDHIRPCASFDLKDPEQQLQCFHYTNLQPLWKRDNLVKGAKWDGPSTRAA